MYIRSKPELVDHLLRFHLPPRLTAATVTTLASWPKDELDDLHRECHLQEHLAS